MLDFEVFGVKCLEFFDYTNTYILIYITSYCNYSPQPSIRPITGRHVADTASPTDNTHVPVYSTIDTAPDPMHTTRPPIEQT